MSRFRVRMGVALGIVLACQAGAGRAQEKKPETKKPKSYRLPATSLKERVLWGSTAESPEGFALSFGGADQQADDGQPHTRIKRDGGWVSIADELRRANPLEASAAELQAARRALTLYVARLRRGYFEGAMEPKVGLDDAAARVAAARAKLEASSKDLGAYHADQARRALETTRLVERKFVELRTALEKPEPLDRSWILILSIAADALDQAVGMVSAEPPPRALSPLVYEPKTKVFVLFGGDHLDYLANDLWVFDPAKPGWQRRQSPKAPAPRANHTLSAAGDGTIKLSGGYRYTSSTDYVGGQYRDLDDGDAVFDLATNAWSGEALADPERRIKREGPFRPVYFYQGEPPDRQAVTKKLAELPANVWTKMNPPQLPRLNRDWGTAVIDPDHDLILRFSGGHSAHGGTDVLHYHLATNRWELCFPVEFPLGQLYTNTEYPEGFNFNLRPWVTGHTYQNYAYDPLARRMLFTGETRYTYYYDPEQGDWAPSAFGPAPRRVLKPAGMNYNSCFYDLTLTNTPQGVVAWTKEGRLFRHQADQSAWHELKLVAGETKLPGSVVDNSTVLYDSKRDRLVFARKLYGDKQPYDGRLFTVDLKTLQVGVLEPEGKDLGAAVPYLCQIRYDADNDLFLAGCTLPPDGEGKPRRTPAYDPQANGWIALDIVGDDPSGPKGRNVSLGMQYDAHRKLFWAVDTNSQVYALKLKRPGKAE